MKRVTGLGGLSFFPKEAKSIYEWYEKHLGIQRAPHGEGVAFYWRDTDDPQKMGLTRGPSFRRTPSASIPASPRS